MEIEKNLAKFESELVEICVKFGKKRDEIELVAITKNRSSSEINELLASGILTIGENRLQEFLAKKDELASCKKHFVGRIQPNKARKIAREFDLVESVASVKVAKILNEEAEKMEKVLPIFLQINFAREPQKDGFLVEEIDSAIAEIVKLANVEVVGLMTIGLFGDANRTREIFLEGRKLCDKFGLAKFSAGMSGDWKIAIEEGANNLRIGRRLFEN